jgi:hypothetical protein
MEQTAKLLCVSPQVQSPDARNPAMPFNGIFTALHRHLIAVILQNPFWGDYHLFCALRKIAPDLSLSEIARLKTECGLGSRKAVCNILLTRLYSDCSSSLNSIQLRFINKQIPEIRDRDLCTDNPGKLLIYQRFGGKRVKGFGRAYAHVFADMFNGHIWGQLSPKKDAGTGLAILEEAIAPFYFAGGYPLKTVMHSAHRGTDLDGFSDFYIKNRCARMGIEWINTARQAGHVDRLKKALLSSHFYEHAIIEDIPYANLQYSFSQWVKQYNCGIKQTFA